jgi:hypothetical protein
MSTSVPAPVIAAPVITTPMVAAPVITAIDAAARVRRGGNDEGSRSNCCNGRNQGKFA